MSRHLRQLEQANLVRHTRRGTRNIFRLHRSGFDEARSWLDGFWLEALDNFARLADGGEE